MTLFLLTACSQAENQKVRLLLEWLPNPDHVIFYTGIEKGIFRKHGIDLEILKANDPADGVPLLHSENTELVLSYAGRTVNAKARGADVKVIAYVFKQPLNSIVFRKDSGIKTPKDLSGCKVGFTMGADARAFLDTRL